jgi:Spy/CpxP family protein refolding chaperone
MNIKGLLALAGIGLALSFSAARVEAQGGGGGGGGGFGGGRPNFDPAQFRQMILDNMRDQLEVTNDAEWKVIGDQVQKVFDAQREQGFGGGLNMMRMLRRNNNNGQGGGNAQGGGRRAGGLAAAFGADIPDPEGEALQSAIDRNAPPAELKAAIAKVAAVRKQKQAKLDQARSDLRELLTPRQEAIAVSLGLL